MSPVSNVSNVSAVVLSVGEPYTQRAIQSLVAQTIPLREIITIENVSPFFRAINEGARRVSTPFFVQVDADMILDPTCVETLLGGVRRDTGIVVGELRDALSTQVVGVKLFRTACFRRAGMSDSISQDTDFVAMLHRLGWRTEFIETVGSDRSAPRPALGEHRPDYTPSYTYRKMLLEGARLRHRAARHGLFWSMGTLEQSSHPLGVLAQIALAHGFFLPLERDELKPPVLEPRADWLVAFLGADGRADSIADGLAPVGRHARLRETFRLFLSAGQAIAQAQAGATFRELFGSLTGTRRDWRALVAKVALGHGLLMDEGDRARLMSDERAFRHFMVFSIGSRATLSDHLRARVVHLSVAGRRSRSFVPW